TLSPHTMTVSYDAVAIWRFTEIGAGTGGNSSLLPGGVDESQVAMPLLEKVDTPGLGLKHGVLAVLGCEIGEREEVMVESCVLGFVYVVDVEESKRRMKILAPVAGRLPN